MNGTLVRTLLIPSDHIQQLFLKPEWALSAEWAFDSEAMKARGIIVLVKSN